MKWIRRSSMAVFSQLLTLVPLLKAANCVYKEETYDFEAFQAGETIREMKHVRVSAVRFTENGRSPALAMAFDSSQPTKQDGDLKTRNKGLVLIVSTNDNSNQPNDHESGGLLVFKFRKTNNTVTRLDVLDAEGGGNIKLYHVNGIQTKLRIPKTDNGARLPIRIEQKNVVKMVVKFRTSAAVSLLKAEFCVDDKVPSPSPTSLSPTSSPSAAPSGSINRDGYHIDVGAHHVPKADVILFQHAARKWQSVIVGDLPAVPSPTNPRRESGCVYPTSIDDLYICAEYKHIDGPGRILGSAGPERIRKDSKLPTIGRMSFDSADAARMVKRGEFEAVIVHEMGHVIGLGTLWPLLGLAGSEAAKCPYYGKKANHEFKKLKPICSSVPIEQGGGSGTRCGHWDEQCFTNEIMTGYLNLGVQAPLSRVTVGGLADIGYEVDYKHADPYRLDSQARCNSAAGRSLRESLGAPYRRRVSEGVVEEAIQWGREQLKLQAASEEDPEEDTIYLGDKLIVVYVFDGDQIVEVPVTSGSD